ncbi:hypothetical protein CRE_28562 [Caenorhabditis remanei]|uniref:AAA+ ATPase domain-containing protein n=1 Tax=Caenorhabditis remanei TaxID=31234 RepID=E3LN24_CAERE|nr:hypothetical protein CRE_28562 [Caenorhabditis remanei]
MRQASVHPRMKDILREKSDEQTLRLYWATKVDEAEQAVTKKEQNVRRLQAQKNELNGKVALLKDEIQRLHEQASHVGEVCKAMDKKKVLVKNNPDGKYIVDVDKDIDINQLVAGTRVAMKAESYMIHKILPNKVRELFVMAREHSPSIIFMDEIDSIGSSRLEGSRGGDSEVQRTMLELLNQLDGFEATKNIKVIMATNRIDILDSALLRPGRIDRKIEFPAPDEKARAQILKIHSRKMNLMRGIRMDKIAEKIPGASGAEVKAVCTEAGMFALRERRIHVTQEDFEMAVGKVMQKDSDKNMSVKKLWK